MRAFVHTVASTGTHLHTARSRFSAMPGIAGKITSGAEPVGSDVQT